MATNEQIEKIIDEAYINTEQEQLESVIREEYNIEFEIRTITEKVKEENMKSKRWTGEIIFFLCYEIILTL